MKIDLEQHRKSPNRAFALLMESTKVLADPIVSADWQADSCGQIVAALEKAWQGFAAECRCKASNLHISTNERYRRQPDEYYGIWFTWGTSNGGTVLATLTLSMS